MKFKDTSTGEIDLAASTPGTYVVTNTITPAGGCAEVKATAEVTITKLPVAEFAYTNSPFCSNAGNATVTLGAGAEKGVFTSGTGLVIDSTTGEINIASSTPGTYTVTNTIAAAKGCGDVIATAEIVITKLPVADFKYSSTAFCESASNPSPEFLNGGAAGTFSSSSSNLVVNSSTGEIDLAASNAGTYTVRNTFSAAGGCTEVTKTFSIQIDPISSGGTSIIATLDDKDEYETPAPARLVTACHLGSGEIEVSADYVGEIIRWESSVDAINWTTINGTADQNLNPYRFTGIETTTLYRAVIKSGECSESYSPISIISVIPADIKPNPVSASPAVVCIGTGTTLTSQSGYATGSYLQGGDFQTGQLNTQDPNGWLVDGSPGGYTASADNTKANHWAGTNPHSFGGQVFDSGDPKFAIANGKLTTSLETPVINSVGLTEFHFGFDQAFNLQSGDKILVELSLDGGKTYIKVLQEITGPTKSDLFNTFAADNTDFDLSQFAGQLQVRIKFTYIGANNNSAWALDNFKFPDEPVGLETVWYNEEGVELGRTEDISIAAGDLEPGVNTFAVTSYINGCRSEGEGGTTYVDVFAYDSFTADAALAEGQGAGCGNNTFKLNAKVFSAYKKSQDGVGEVTSFTADDTFSARWIVQGKTAAESDPLFDDPTKPNAVFSTDDEGDYVLLWTVTPKNVTGQPANTCGSSIAQVNVTIKNCVALDFDGVDDYVDLVKTYNDGPYSVEAWIRPKAKTVNGTDTNSAATIISGPKFKITMNDLAGYVSPDGRWYHIAASNGKLYIDGIAVKAFTLTGDSERAFIGAKWTAPNAINFFSGWIEEVRIWNGNISQEQIRFLMNQRLQNTANIGVEIPMKAPGLDYSALAGYYQLLITTILNGGYTPNLTSLPSPVNGKLRNMTTLQENTAPLPYTTKEDGTWFDDDGTWTYADVWDPPYSEGVAADVNTGEKLITWNIAKVSHDVISGNQDIKLLGLLSEAGTLDIQGANPVNSWTTGGTGTELYISHYLLLNGTIDLNGESQLVQPMLSIVDGNSNGVLYRDQQGTASSYNYNYWSSPVSPKASYNSSYLINTGGAMLDGTDPANPREINFGNAYTHADVNGYGQNESKKISRYWLHKFHGTANNYFSWEPLEDYGYNVVVGEGFSMKGTSGSAAISDAQNYTFKGLPNNGDISPGSTAPNQNYLIGNPYPSAIDAAQFIDDNISGPEVFNGTLYFWDHFAGHTHYLEEYIGGYAILNKSGGTAPATSNDSRINDNGDTNEDKRPGNFIPVGQAFFVNTVIQFNPDGSDQDTLPDPVSVSGGNVVFKNSQRVFKKESSNSSVFFSQERKGGKSPNVKTKQSEDTRQKIWIKYKSPKGYHRQLAGNCRCKCD